MAKHKFQDSQPNDPKSTPEARGRRVESLRRMTRLSRRAFQERYGIPAGSLQNWEDAKGYGLSANGAHKLITVLKPDGIFCTVDWLLHGVGQGPQLTERSFLDADAISTLETEAHASNEEALIAKELLIFRQHYPKTAVDFVVNDDGMEPRYIKDEWVAGCRRHRKDFQKLVGHDCIVQLASGELLLRTLKKIDDQDRCTLVCSNPHTSVEKPVLYDVELMFAAPVLWTRRKMLAK
jgi:HTH-type transcriptional regulator, cell division transcriptional repressor